MKALLDRTKVILYIDEWAASDIQNEDLSAADGIALSVTEDTLETLDDFFERLPQQNDSAPLSVLLQLDTPLSDDGIRKLLSLIRRRNLEKRLILRSAYHKTLDAVKKTDNRLSISPVCDENLVRPWIYAAYLGAEMLCADAKTLLSDADAYGCPTIDSAHNYNICIYAEHAEDEETMRALVKAGCDAIFTHSAALARELVW